MQTFQFELGGRPLVVETGKFAKQANGAVMIRYGDTALVVAATTSAAPRAGKATRSFRPFRAPATSASLL